MNKTGRVRILSAIGVIEVPVVTVTGHVEWGGSTFDADFGLVQSNFGETGPREALQMYIYFAQASNKGQLLSSVCTNPAISNAFKTTTSKSDITERWLAAQNLFITGQAKKQLDIWIGLGAPITLLIDGKSYKGYTVFYADGFSEVWVINPGWFTSSIKLFDAPAPNSLKPPKSTTNNPMICVKEG